MSIGIKVMFTGLVLILFTTVVIKFLKEEDPSILIKAPLVLSWIASAIAIPVGALIAIWS